MRSRLLMVACGTAMCRGGLSAPVVAQEKKGETQRRSGTGEGQAEKVAGDIGLLDTEKNYMIVVTRKDKLVTLDFNTKTKVTEIKETKVKMTSRLGSSASIEYVTRVKRIFLPKWNSPQPRASNYRR